MSTTVTKSATGETSLSALLSTLKTVLSPETFVFLTLPNGQFPPPSLFIQMLFREVSLCNINGHVDFRHWHFEMRTELTSNSGLTDRRTDHHHHKRVGRNSQVGVHLPFQDDHSGYSLELRGSGIYGCSQCEAH